MGNQKGGNISLSTGQVTDTYRSVLGRDPTGSELSSATNNSAWEGSPGQTALATSLRSAGGVQGSLDSFASGLSSAISSPGIQTTDQIIASLKEQGLYPTTPAPDVPNLVQTYQDLATQKGVDAIQTSITDLKAQQDTLAAQLRTNVKAEQNKPVAENVIAGRVSVQQSNVQDKYDFVSRQLSRKTDELNSALGAIKTIIDLTGQDYQNASQSYTTQFTQAIDTINLVRGIQNDQKTEQQRQIDNARANLQIYTNAITKGNLDFGSLSPDQQAQINKLEVQSGLPVGFTASLKLDPGANIVTTSSDQGQIQVLVRNSDGSMSLQTYGTKSGTASDQKSADLNATRDNAANDAKRGATLQQLVDHYAVSGGLSIDDVYQIYNSNTKRGQAKESLDAVKQGIYATQKGFDSSLYGSGY